MMDDIPLAIKGIALEIIGGALVIAWIFSGIAVVVGVCDVIEYIKGFIRGRS